MPMFSSINVFRQSLQSLIFLRERTRCLSSLTTLVFRSYIINKGISRQRLTRLPIKLLFCVVWSKPSKAFAAIEIMFTTLIELGQYCYEKVTFIPKFHSACNVTKLKSPALAQNIPLENSMISSKELQTSATVKLNIHDAIQCGGFFLVIYYDSWMFDDPI